MKHFEDFIKENREKLDTEKVNPNIWLNIENQYFHQANIKNKKKIKWLVTCSILILLGLICSVIYNQMNSDPVKIIHENQFESKNYTQLVDFKTNELKSALIPENRKEDFDLLLKQLEFLDDQYHDYLQYVKKNGYQEFIGSQILDYYKTKVELLNKIQEEIKAIEYYENRNNHKSDKVNLSI